VVDLTLGSATGAAGNDLLRNIESVQGSDYADRITGDAGVNDLRGRGGDDTINGNDGDDTLWGGLGQDILNGGSGIDFVNYGSATDSVFIDLSQGRTTGADGTDTLIAIENARGSNYDDVLTGDGGANDLRGLLGNDLLIGGDGNDRIAGGSGDDHVIGGYGEDILLGNDGVDTLDYDIAVGSGGPYKNLRIDLTDGHLYEVDNSNNITYASNEQFSGFENVIGWGANDFITGDNSANRLDGRAGNDVLTGGVGNDTFIFSQGADRVSDFQKGFDHIEISSLFGAHAFNQLGISQAGSDTRIVLGTNSLVLSNFLASSLDSSDFTFVA
jgi:Ca2+-binding RTX toxin-like protein